MGTATLLLPIRLGRFSIIYGSAGIYRPYFLPIGVTFPPVIPVAAVQIRILRTNVAHIKDSSMACLFHFISAVGPCVPGHILILYNLPYICRLHVRPVGQEFICSPFFSFCFFLVSSRHPLWSFVIGIIRQGISFTFQNLAACT